MNNNLEYEYEIDLKDLCINVLRKWRAILLAAVVGAILLGAFRIVSNLREEPGLVMSSSELEAAEEEVDTATKAITTAETEITRLEGEITKAETSIETNEETIENLDNKIALAESRLENLNKFLDNYNAALEKLMEVGEMDAEMADTMTSYLVQIDTIQSSILSKETEIMNLYESGPKLEETNEELLETIEDYEDQIEVQEEEIAAQEELIAELEEQMAETAPADLKSGVAKYIILGAFLGVCVICAYVFLRYCFDKTVHLEEDLTRYTRLHVLGSVDYTERDTSKKKNPIDRLLDRFSGIDLNEDHSPAMQCGIAAAKIQVLTANKKLLVTGTIQENTIQKVSADLKNHLPQQEYEVVCAENPMYHSEELLRMVDYELVLVEAPHVTKVKELLDLIRFLKLSDVKVIGIVSVTE